MLTLASAPLLGSCDQLFKIPDGNVAGGFYQGTLTDTTKGGSSAVTAIVTEDGRAKIALGNVGNGTAIFDIPSLTPDNGHFDTDYTLYTSAAGVPPESGTIRGNTAARRSITARFNANSPPDSGLISLGYDAQRYRQGASLAVMAGAYNVTYTDARGAAVIARLTLASDGSISGNDSDGCSYGGQLSVPDSDFNAYAGSLTQSCGSGTASYDVLGSASVAPVNSAPRQLLLLGTDAAGQRAAQFVLNR